MKCHVNAQEKKYLLFPSPNPFTVLTSTKSVWCPLCGIWGMAWGGANPNNSTFISLLFLHVTNRATNNLTISFFFLYWWCTLLSFLLLLIHAAGRLSRSAVSLLGKPHLPLPFSTRSIRKIRNLSFWKWAYKYEKQIQTISIAPFQLSKKSLIFNLWRFTDCLFLGRVKWEVTSGWSEGLETMSSPIMSPTSQILWWRQTQVLLRNATPITVCNGFCVTGQKTQFWVSSTGYNDQNTNAS